MPRFTRPPFELGRNDPCFCGSGEKFRRCCGSSSVTRPPPSGVVVVDNYLSPAECAEWVALLDRHGSERLKVIDIDRTATGETARRYDDVTDFFCENLRRHQQGQPLLNYLAEKELGFPRPAEAAWAIGHSRP